MIAIFGIPIAVRLKTVLLCRLIISLKHANIALSRCRGIYNKWGSDILTPKT